VLNTRDTEYQNREPLAAELLHLEEQKKREQEQHEGMRKKKRQPQGKESKETRKARTVWVSLGMVR